MNILRVIVDEMPEGCLECLFYCTLNKRGEMYHVCNALNTNDNSRWRTGKEWKWDKPAVTRPDWCPLEKYCEICDGVGFVLHATQGTMPCPECNQESESERWI